MIKSLLILGIMICGLSYASHSAILYGKVSSVAGESLPFANVFVEGSSIGTTTNSEGAYQLNLDPGSHNIVFRFIGFKSEIRSITVGIQNIRLDIELKPEAVLLRDVIINASDEDPAYRIIRNAIANRQKHLEETNAYSCKVYIKGLQKFLSIPKRVSGIKVDLGDQVDVKSGVGYLSETVSYLHYEYPDKIKEEIISSKVSGNNRAFSFNRASDLMFNPYQNIISLGGISNRPFISPIADQAFLYYKYRLVGNFEDQGRLIYKIEVYPRREFDPVFRGTIFIEDENYHIQETNLYLTRQTQMEILDTLRLKQTYNPVSKNNWLPISLNLSFRFSILGFVGDGYFHAVYSDYKFKKPAELQRSKMEKVVIYEDANKKDSTYWDTVRPIPLSNIEFVDYIRRDSIIDWKSQPEVRDSIRKKENAINPGKLLLGGYTYTNKEKDWEFKLRPLLTSLSFNTIQGYKGTVDLRIKKQMSDHRSFTINPIYSAGFSDPTPNLVLNLELKPEQQHFTAITLSGGREYSQFNPANPVSEIKSLYETLLFKNNPKKLFNSEFISISGSREFINGLYAGVELKNSIRKPLLNNTLHTWFDHPNKFYTSNDPQNADNTSFSFSTHKALESNIHIRYVLNQQYENIGGRKRILNENSATVMVGIRTGIPDVAESITDFSELYADISGPLFLAMGGSGTWKIRGGYFINNNSMEFMDLHHTRTHKNNFDPYKFMLLKYYESSTDDYYFESHYEHRFKGLIWNKLPLLRRLKIDEIAGIHFLQSDQKDKYLELTAGLEKLNLRFDLVMSISPTQRPQFGFKWDAKLP